MALDRLEISLTHEYWAFPPPLCVLWDLAKRGSPPVITA